MDDWKAELAESFWEIERSNKVLRTKKDRDGDRWSEVAPDVWYSTPPMSLHELEEEYGPLTDVTDTGEPLDTEPTYTGQCVHREERRCARPSGHTPSNEHDYSRIAQWEADLLEQQSPGGTPRKPESGDRVSTTLNDENGSTVVGEYVYVEQDAVHGQALIAGEGFLLRVRLSEVTVIEPARPAVPEEPAGDVAVMDEGTTQYVWDERPDCFDDLHWRAEDGTHYTWEALWEKFGPLYKVERGPVIGG